jgi:CSLREA domain-containing protein
MTVSKTADTQDGVCDTDCSLREAVSAANASPGADTIMLPAGIYALTIPGADEDMAATGDLDVTDSVTIQGAGASTTVVDGGGLDRVFHVPQATTVTIADITIRNGVVDGAGGGIWINSGSPSGVTTLDRVVVTRNTSTNGGGIALPNGGQLSINASTISNNTTSGVGGGIQNYDGVIALNNTTISGNTASSPGGGGGIYNYFGPNGGIVNLRNSTVTANISTVSMGSGVVNYAGTVKIGNTILAGNTGPDCSGGPLLSTGYNLVQNPGCSITGTLTGNLTGKNANLGPLLNNGGTTLTHVLLPGSPAIDAGSPVAPESSDGACRSTDQRGITRPQGSRCDIGAYELTTGGTIGGVVYNPIAKTTFPGVTVRLDTGGFGGSPSFTAISDIYGTVSFMNVTPGPYQLTAFPPDGWIGTGRSITVAVSDLGIYYLPLKKDIPLLSPSNHGAVETPHPWLCWENLPQAVSYTLLLNEPGGSLMANPTGSGNCYQVAAELQQNTTYSWSLANALDNQGTNIGGSQTFQFSYHTEPISQSITTETAATLTSWDQSTVIDFPSGSVMGTGTVTYQAVVDFPDPFALNEIVKSFTVNATTPLADGATYQVEYKFGVAGVQGVIPASLAFYSWDANTQQWLREPTSQLDLAHQTLTAAPGRFSTWAVIGEVYGIYLPIIRR